MEGVSKASDGTRSRPARLARSVLAPAAAVVAALSLAVLALSGPAREARAQPPECGSGTVPFFQQFEVPAGTFDPNDLPLGLPPNIAITIVPQPGSNVDLVLVDACVAIPTPGPGTPFPNPLAVRFTTPTPSPGTPVVTVKTATPTAAPTQAPTATAAAPTQAPSVGVRPPSTGDGGLASGPSSSPAVSVFIVLAAGLAAGLAPIVGRGARTGIRPRRDSATPAGLTAQGGMTAKDDPIA